MLPRICFITGGSIDSHATIKRAFGLAAALVAGRSADPGLDESSFTALLEITNRRRTGGAFNFGAFGLLLRLGCGTLLGAVALRFNINNQTNEPSVGSDKSINHREHAASDEMGAFLAVKLELRTPED